MPINDIRDTIVLMISDDYIDRFKAEYYQLKIRHEKLLNIIARADSGTLDFELKSSISILAEQCGVMGRYLKILESRAKIEEIVL